MGSSSSPPPHDRIKRDISPKERGGARPSQIAYSGALRAAPANRRRLPQVPGRGGRGRGGGGSGPAGRGARGQFYSMDRGHRRQVHGRPQAGFSGNSGYSDTEMLGEQDTWSGERHKQRLDRLRLERDGGAVTTMTPSTAGAFHDTQSLISEPQFSARGGFSDQQSYGGWSWRSQLGGQSERGGYMSDTQSVCGYTSDTGYRPSDRNYPPPPIHATSTAINR